MPEIFRLKLAEIAVYYRNSVVPEAPVLDVKYGETSPPTAE